MRVRTRRKSKLLAIMLIAIMLISVGYAFLSTQLTINGTATVKNNSWNIYFTNVQIKTGSITADTAPSVPEGSTSTTTLNWEVSMNTPGQFYEFNVDVVNAGTIDAMINTATADIVTSQLTNEQKAYLDYSIKYVNGADVERFDKLAAGETKTITVKLLFRQDIEPEVLPSTAQNGISLSYTTNYVQADNNAVEKVTALTGEGTAVGILQNKKISILGDSISTLKTYIPATNRARYVANQEEAVGGLIYIPYNETWWGRLISDYNMTLGINESWAGSRVSNTSDSNSGDIGPDRAMASITRIQALDDNGTPDVIFFFGGTNDIGNSVTLGTFDDTASYATTLDTTSTKYNSFVEAYSITLMRLKHYYPNATIIALLPLSTSSYYSDASLRQYKEQMKNICDFHNVKYIDLGNAGINSSNLSTYLVDGIHPNSNGMQLLSNYIVSRLNLNAEEEINDENTTNTHLQALPENMTSTTNLYTALTPELGYYSDSGYVYAENNGKYIISVTIPVQEGDHISANSFGISAPAGVNKSGIRCTMLNDGEIVRSLSPSEVYSAYTTNGYVEIPSGVNSVNIAWWGEDESNWAYLGDWNGHAQLLPENVTSSTNLYTALTPQTGFYNATGYTNYLNVVSITIPVQEGDRISANSFGTNSVSGSTNGIRCTMLKGNKIVSSLTPAEVYSAYTTDGYVEIPSGVNFVNIAWWEANESNWANFDRP